MKMIFFGHRLFLVSLLLCFCSGSLVQAGTLGILTYSISGDSVTITDCNSAATGEVVVPASIESKPVTVIGNKAFQYCRSLTNITLPSGVSSIEDQAFNNCSSLTNITLPTGVTTFGLGAFSGCIALPNITIPASVTTIGSASFFGCRSLMDITIPAGANTIGESVFRGCESLLSITVEVGNLNFKSVDGVLFSSAQYKLFAYPAMKPEADYSIPANVHIIGEYAFGQASALTNITLPSNLTLIESGAFEGCSSLIGITIPTSVTSIRSYTFDDCSSLSYINVEPGNLNYVSIDGVLLNAAQTEIVRYPPMKTDLSFTIPSTVAYIQKSAFEYCGSLESITLPDGVISIGSSAFQDCSSLESITLPTGLIDIDYNMFAGCSSLTGITIPASIETIDGNAFLNCSSLTNISLPAGLTSIGYFAFGGCSSLPGFTIPAGVTSIGGQPLFDCAALMFIDVEVGNSHYVSSAGVLFDIDQTELIAYPVAITNVSYTVPASVDTIAINAFRNSNQLLSILVEPGNVDFSSIDGVLFNGGQTELIIYPEGRAGDYSIPDGVTTIAARAFYGCSLLTDIAIPSGVTHIGYWGFEWCPLLTEVSLPDSVTRLDAGAFYRCSGLTSITIPSGVDNVGSMAFWDCSGLRTVQFLGNAPQTFGSDVFLGTDANFTVHYSSGNSGFTSPMWKGYPATPWFMDNGLDPDADLAEDPNEDGVDLLTAYALNLNPDMDLSGSLPGAVIDQDAMNMTYYAVSPGVTYTVETSEDMETWTTNGVSVSGLDPENQRTAMVDLTAPHRFLRLKVEK